MPIVTEEEPEDTDEDAPCRVRQLRTYLYYCTNIYFSRSVCLAYH